MSFTGKDPGYIPGPRQPQVVDPHDETTHAERERALRIVPDVAERVKRGQYQHDDSLAVLRVVFERVRDG